MNRLTVFQEGGELAMGEFDSVVTIGLKQALCGKNPGLDPALGHEQSIFGNSVNGLVGSQSQGVMSGDSERGSDAQERRCRVDCGPAVACGIIQCQ